MYGFKAVFGRFIILFALAMVMAAGAVYSAVSVPVTAAEAKWLQNHPVIRVGVTPDWEPIVMFDAKGNLTGIAGDFKKILEERLDVKLDVVDRGAAWRDVLGGLRTRRLDMVMFAGEPEGESDFMNYTQPALELPLAVITKTGNSKIRNIGSLQGKVVAVRESLSAHSWLVKQYPDVIILPKPTVGAALSAVALGEADAFLGNLAVASYDISKLGLSGLEVAFDVPRTAKIYIGVRSDYGDLLSILNSALLGIDQRQRDKIWNQWVILEHPGIEKEDVYIIVLAMGLVIILISLYGIYRLRRANLDMEQTVADRTRELALAYESARKSARMLEAAQAIAHLGGWEWHISSGTLTWSAETYRIFGLKPNSVTPTYSLFLKTVHPEDRRKLENAVNEALATGLPYKIEHRIVLPDGSERVVQEMGEIHRAPDGKPERIIGTVYDITEMARAREDLHLYKMLIEKTSDPVYMIDQLDCRMTFVNEAAVKHYGASRDEILTWRIPDWDPNFNEADLPKHVEAVKANPGMVIESVHKRKDGASVPVEISLNPITYKGRDYHFGYFKNITEKKKAKEELEKALALAKENEHRADEANRAKSDFLANMSHELRTPLNGIIGLTDLLLESNPDQAQEKHLRMIRFSGQALLTLVNDILDLAKIEAGKFTLDRVPFNLRDIVEHTALQQAVLAHDKGLELIARIESSVPLNLVGDPDRLKQVLVNLVGNAIKFTHQGEIVITATPVGNPAPPGGDVEIQFAISDTGIGIPSHRLESIFQRFTQADETTTRKYGGAGLGTTISKQLVDLMGGRIWAESTVGKGSVFKFTARFARDPHPAKHTPVEKEKLAGLNVLVVDDNATNRLVLEEMLDSWGMRHISAETAEAAIKLLAVPGEKTFDIAIVDYKMPGMDGLELASEIKKNPACEKTRVMLLSSLRGGIATMAHAIGADACLTKPVRQSELLEAIQDVFGTLIRSTPEQQPVQPPSSTLPAGFTVMLVEDNPVNREVAEMALRKIGAKVVYAANGLEAVGKFQDGRPDFILMDVQMPVMDGLTATREIRAIENKTGGHVPITAMTARAMKEDEQACLDAGMDDYLAKPLDVAKLREKIVTFTRSAHGGAASGMVTIKAHTGSGKYNLAPLEELAGGDQDAIRKILMLYIKTASATVEDIAKTLDSGDYHTTSRLAHSMKGSSSQLGATGVVEAARLLESAAMREDAAQTGASAQRLKEELAALKSTLERDILK